MCGIVGIYNSEVQASKLVHRAMISIQHRGQEAAGIVAFDKNNRLTHIKRKGLVSEKINVKYLDKLKGSMAIGHVRYSTVSNDSSKNIQPFVSYTKYGEVAIAHNGHIKNYNSLKSEIFASGAVVYTSMDTELLMHLISHSQGNDFIKAIHSLESYIDGAYSLILSYNNKIYGVKDKNGMRPLALGKMDGGYILASESCAFNNLGAEFVRELDPGEIVEISEDGISTVKKSSCGTSLPCVFELIYFSRPDSLVFNKSVYNARLRMGEVLAKEDNVDADIVIPVPNSGIVSSLGYSYYSGIRYGQPLVRNSYTGRTFIMPTHNGRLDAIRNKLAVSPHVIDGKRVVLVDDSIVRGNTSKKVVSLLREYGAKEVHFRVASPPVCTPCYYGIDTPTYEELIARVKNIKDIKNYIGADSLRYLSIEGLKESTGKNYCFMCLNR